MAYTVNYSDTTKTPITVTDGTLNDDTSLNLVGRNFYGYGDEIASSQLHLLENFASPTAPRNPTQGQFWYDTSASGDMKHYDGNNWVSSPTSLISTVTMTDNNSVTHDVVAIKDSGVVMSVYSSVAFTTNATDPLVASFPTVGVGVTLTQGAKFHGTATSAEYADLAELYSSDAAYTPGTIVKIGGEAEVTQTTNEFCPEVFGIVSTDPAYLMNSTLEGTAVAVALEGRVPCRVIGPVRKGQRLVSSETPGVARAVSDYERQEAWDWYRIVGRALADKTTESEGLLEVVVGAK